MAAADMATWRRQNSDTHPVELELIDGSVLRGTLLVSRDKTMREFFNVGTDAFVDFDCKLDGPIVLAKASVRKVRIESAQKQGDQSKIDALAARRAELEKADPYKLLGVAPNGTAEDLHKAYITKARMYHPDRYADAGLPPEVFDYLNAMARRINGAYKDLDGTMASATKK
jgi:hypothetical protein